MKKQKINFLFMGAIMSVLILASCSDDDAPEEENPEEVIDLVTLTFEAAGADPIVVTATDSDAEGPEDLSADGQRLAVGRMRPRHFHRPDGFGLAAGLERQFIEAHSRLIGPQVDREWIGIRTG